MAILHVGDYGVLLRLTVQQDGAAKDISTATTKQIKLYKPSGEVVTYTGSFTTNGTDGRLEAATASGDFDEAGSYRACAYLVISGWYGMTSSVTFTVREQGR